MSSGIRTIVYSVPPPGCFTPAIQSWPAKRPLDYLDYSVDLALWLNDAGSTLSRGFASETSDQSLSLFSPTTHGTVVTIWLSGGTVGVSYFIDLVITTIDGHRLDLRIGISVVAGLPALPDPTAGLTSNSGIRLTTDSGIFLTTSTSSQTVLLTSQSGTQLTSNSGSLLTTN